jgi:hypothetical protein
MVGKMSIGIRLSLSVMVILAGCARANSFGDYSQQTDSAKVANVQQVVATATSTASGVDRNCAPNQQTCATMTPAAQTPAPNPMDPLSSVLPPGVCLPRPPQWTPAPTVPPGANPMWSWTGPSLPTALPEGYPTPPAWGRARELALMTPTRPPYCP